MNTPQPPGDSQPQHGEPGDGASDDNRAPHASGSLLPNQPGSLPPVTHLDTHSLEELEQTRRNLLVLAVAGADIAGWLPELWRASLLACTLRSRADRYSDALLALLALAGQAEEAIHLAETRTTTSQIAAGLLAVASALAWYGPTRLAQTVCGRAQALAATPATRQALAVALALARQQDTAQTLVAGLTERHARTRVHRAVVQALAHAGRQDEGLQWITAMSEESDRADLLAALVRWLAEAGRVDGLAELVAMIPLGAAQVWALGHLAAAQAGRGQVAAASASADAALAAAQQLPMLPDQMPSPFHGAVKALAAAGRVAEALVLVASLPSGLAQAWAHGDLMATLVLLGEDTRGGAMLAGITDARMQTTARMHVAMELARTGRVTEALAWAEEIAEDGWRKALLREAVLGLGRAGAFPDAVALSAHLPVRTQVVVLAESALALVHTHGATHAPALVAQLLPRVLALPAAFWHSHGLSALACALARRGRPDDAAAVLDRSDDPDGRATATPALAVALARAGRVAEATALAPAATSTNTRDDLLHDVVVALAETGQVAAALRLAGTTEGNTRVWMEAGIARALGSAGQAEAARALLDRLPAHRRVQEVPFVARELAASGAVADALDLARTGANGLDQAEALCFVAEVLLRNGEGEAARVIAREAANVLRTTELPEKPAGQASDRLKAQAVSYVRNQTLAAVVQVLAQAGQFGTAIESAGCCTDSTERAVMLGRIAALREPPLALRAALAAVESLPAAIQPVVLQRMVEIFAAAGRPDEATTLAARITEPSREPYLRGLLAQGLARAGRAADAWAQLAGLADARDRMQRVLVEILARSGQVAAAACYAPAISDPHERAEALIALAHAAAQDGRWEEALQHACEASAVARTTGDARGDLLGQVAGVIGNLTHLPTAARCAGQVWAEATTEDELLALLPAAVPLLVARPALLRAILAGCDEVQALLRS